MQFNLRQNDHIGSDTPERVSPPSSLRALHARGIMLAGLSDAGRGYFMHRPRPPRNHLLVTIGGSGRVWVNGKWTECRTGCGYVSPSWFPCAFETQPRRRWQFAWVFLFDTETPLPGAFSMEGSTLIRADAEPLATAIEGLYREGTGHASGTLLEHWAELVHAYALRIVQPDPAHHIDQLGRLWSEVDSHLEADWSLSLLADLARLNRETLRKVCLLHYQRSPMEQVTHLRMRRAEILLRSTSAKLSVIARKVGYENVFAFSTAFKRVIGVSPSEQRHTRS